MSCNDLDDVLVHIVTIVPPELTGEDVVYDEYGDPIKGSSIHRRVPCFIDKRVKRHLDPSNRIAIYTSTITFNGDVPVEVDWEVRDGISNFGVVLLIKGKIAYVDLTQSPEEGIIAKLAGIEEL